MLPIANMIGGAIQGSSGIGSLHYGFMLGKQAKRKRAEYDEYERTIPLDDAEQRAHLNTQRRMRQAYETATDPISRFASQQARSMGAQAQTNAVRMGRGNLGDLMRIQRNTDLSLGGIGAAASRNAIGLLAQEGQLVGAMAERRYNRQLSKANRLWSEYAQLKEDSNAAKQAGIAMLAASGSTFGGGSGEQQQVPKSTALSNNQAQQPSATLYYMPGGYDNGPGTAPSLTNYNFGGQGFSPSSQWGGAGGSF